MSARICAWPNCSTILSRYNPNDRCSVHVSAGDPWWYFGPTRMTPADAKAYETGEWLGR